MCFEKIKLTKMNFTQSCMSEKKHGIVPYFVQVTEIIGNIIFSMMHYLLLCMHSSNDDLALGKQSDQRGMDLNS